MKEEKSVNDFSRKLSIANMMCINGDKLKDIVIEKIIMNVCQIERYSCIMELELIGKHGGRACCSGSKF